MTASVQAVQLNPCRLCTDLELQRAVEDVSTRENAERSRMARCELSWRAVSTTRDEDMQALYVDLIRRQRRMTPAQKRDTQETVERLGKQILTDLSIRGWYVKECGADLHWLCRRAR